MLNINADTVCCIKIDYYIGKDLYSFAWDTNSDFYVYNINLHFRNGYVSSVTLSTSEGYITYPNVTFFHYEIG